MLATFPGHSGCVGADVMQHVQRSQMYELCLRDETLSLREHPIIAILPAWPVRCQGSVRD